MKNKIYLIVSGALLIYVSSFGVASAAGFFDSNSDLQGIVSKLFELINSTVIPLIVSLAVVAFLWGVMLFVLNAGNDEGRKKGKDVMIYGIIGLAVMVSYLGLVAFVTNTFGTNTITPQFKSKGSPAVPAFNNNAPKSNFTGSGNNDTTQ